MNFKTVYRLAIYGALGIALCVALAHLVGFLDFRTFVDYMPVLLGSAAILLAIGNEDWGS